MGAIYRITHKESGTTYVGSSVDIEQRWRCHRSTLRNGKHRNIYLQRAWDKYGEGAFVFGVLEEVEDEMLLVMEQEYLDAFFDRGRCYNLATIAGAGGPVSEEARRKISEAMAGKKHTGEHRRKNSEAKKGNQHALGYKHTDEARRNMSEAQRGKKHTEETRRKLSEGRVGHEVTEATRRKIGEAQRGKKLSEETRRKMSTAAMGNQNALGRRRKAKDGGNG